MKTLLLLALMLISFSMPAQTMWSRYIHAFYMQCNDPDSTVRDETYLTISAGNGTITGTTNKVFVVFPFRGDVVVDSLIYSTFITSKTYTLSFRCTDAAGAYIIQKRKVVLRKSKGVRLPPLVTIVL